MSNYKQADRRLVQPRPEHYKEREGVKYLCGPYSLEQRDKYFEAMVSLHKTRHPDVKQSVARRAVFQKWRNLVFASIDDEYTPSVDPSKYKRSLMEAKSKLQAKVHKGRTK